MVGLIHGKGDAQVPYSIGSQKTKVVLRGGSAKRLKEVFQGISLRYEFEVDTMEVKQDYAHLFLTAPPRYALSEIVQIRKSIPVKVVFREFPEVEKQLLGVGCGVKNILSGLLGFLGTRLPLMSFVGIPSISTQNS